MLRKLFPSESISREAFRPVMSPVRKSVRRNGDGQQGGARPDDSAMAIDDDDELPRKQLEMKSSPAHHFMLQLGNQYDFLDKFTPIRSVGAYDDLVHIDDGIWDVQSDGEVEDAEDAVEVKSEEENAEIEEIEVDELEEDDRDPIDSFAETRRQEELSTSASGSKSTSVALGKQRAIGF